MKIIIIVLLIYLIISFILFLLVSLKLPLLSKILDKLAGMELNKYKEIIEKELKWFNKIEYKDIYIKSKDNLKLHAIYIDNKKSNKVIILSHGYRSTARRDIYPSCHEYYKLGFSLLIIDQRTSNLSKGHFITYGYKEREDLSLWIDYIHKKHKKIILAGISMGATSTLMTPEINNKIEYIIVDSGYINAYEETKYTLTKLVKIPAFMFMPTINIFCILIARFNLKKVDTVKALENINNIPILFVHGEEDLFVPIMNTYTNYDKYKGPKDILTIPDANHGMGYLVDKDKYIKKIKEFIKYADKQNLKK